MTACRHTGQVSWALYSAVWEERSPCPERNDRPPSGAHLSPLIRGRGQATNSDRWAHYYKAEARWINLISCDQLKYSHFSSPSVTSIWQASSTAREILFVSYPIWSGFFLFTSPIPVTRVLLFLSVTTYLLPVLHSQSLPVSHMQKIHRHMSPSWWGQLEEKQDYLWHYNLIMEKLYW